MAADYPDYYVVLGVSRGANLTKIKRAYRRVAKSFHPDTALHKNGCDKFIEIRKAYEILSDDKKRRRYDAQLARQESDVRVHHKTQTDITPSPFSRHVDQRTAVNNELFNAGIPEFLIWNRKRPENRDLYYEVVLTPQEAAVGGLFSITVPVLEQCAACGGGDLFMRMFCSICKGRGYVEAHRKFSLSIPSHTRHGTQVKVSLADIGLKNTYLYIFVVIHSMR